MSPFPLLFCREKSEELLLVRANSEDGEKVGVTGSCCWDWSGPGNRELKFNINTFVNGERKNHGI